MWMEGGGLGFKPESEPGLSLQHRHSLCVSESDPLTAYIFTAFSAVSLADAI